MQLECIIISVIVVPILLLVVLFVCYMNRGKYDAGKKIRAMRIALERIVRATTKI